MKLYTSQNFDGNVGYIFVILTLFITSFLEDKYKNLTMSLLKSTTSDSRVYIGNLPQFVRQRDLEDHFDKYGKVRGIDIHSKFDPAFAFVEFEDAR